MTAFGTALKEWRTQRRMSQLDLGLSADVSSRHISFLETGRARPSRGMVIRLCEELDVPRPARNHLLTAAGLAPAYSERNLSDEDMAPLRDAVTWMLDRHAPYPAFSVDRHWRVQQMNPASTMMLSMCGVQPGDSVVDALATNEAMRSAIDNLDEVITYAVTRLRTESAHLGGDPVLDAAAAKLATEAQLPDVSGLVPAFIPARYRMGDQVLSFFSTFTQFGSVEDIALSELKIEMLFPADAETRMAMEALAR